MRKIIAWIEETLGRAWQRTQRSTYISRTDAGLFRIAYGLFTLLFSMPFYGWIGGVPQGLFDPPILSVAAIFSDFPPGLFFRTCDVLMVVLVLLITLGVATRWASLALAVLSFFLSSFAYSFGKIDHDVLFKIIPLVMAFSEWGASYALRPERSMGEGYHRMALGCFGIFIAFGMFTAGLEKAYVWIDFDTKTSGFLSWFYSGYFSLGRRFLLAPFVLQISPSSFELADYTAVFFELSGMIFLLWSRKAWCGWLLVACVFHLINTLVLNIAFTAHAMVYGLYLLPPALRWMSGPVSATRRQFYFAAVPVGVALLHMMQRMLSGGSELLLISDLAVAREWELYVGLGVWTLMTFVALRTFLLPQDYFLNSVNPPAVSDEGVTSREILPPRQSVCVRGKP